MEKFAYYLKLAASSSFSVYIAIVTVSKEFLEVIYEFLADCDNSNRLTLHDVIMLKTRVEK